METEQELKFDIQLLGEKFQAALHEEDDVRLQLYLESFEELNKFFLLMGGLFGFISDDLNEKIKLLYQLHNEANNLDYFSTVKSMIEYEKQNQLLNKSEYVSGSRTLLRLHRGLDFIHIFLKKLGDLENGKGTAGICRDAYDQTLAKHHPFIIRTGARFAIYTLPTKDVLLKQVCVDDENIKNSILYLPQALQTISLVFNRIENLYTVHDLHTLP